MLVPLHPILQLQQAFGNRAVRNFLRRSTIQAKSALGKPGNVYEQQTDGVMRMPDSAVSGRTSVAPSFRYNFGKFRIYTDPISKDGAPRIQKLENKSETSQELGMNVVTYSDGRIEATVNQAWTEGSGIGSTVVGMARVTGVSEKVLIGELVTSGAYRDETQVRSGFIVGTRIIAKDGEVEEISISGKVYKSGGKQKPAFEDFLEEGVEIFRKADFGLCGGEGAGRDSDDGYDARYWVEQKRRGVIRAKVPAWDAMDKLVRNIGKDIPKAGGGTTKWSFDCLEATLILRLYAIWRTTDRDEFNAKYNPLEFGFHALTDTGLSKAFHCDGPGQQAYRIEGEYHDGVWTNYREIPMAKSMEALAIEAPIGSLIAFSSKVLRERCAADSSPDYCAFQNENTIKLGPDRYFAHPFGAVSSGRIYQELAEAAGATPSLPYYKKDIFISTIRYPR